MSALFAEGNFIDEDTIDITLFEEDVFEEEISSFSLDTPLFAEKTSPPKEKKYDPSSAETCKPDIQPYQVNVRHLEWEGIGYKEGYTTLQGFVSHACGRYVPFFDARGHVFNNGKFAANGGLGLRYIFNPAKSMIGANVYYDYRGTTHHNYNQIGAGLEGFYDRWEFHANGYFPLGSTSHKYDKELLGSTFKGFQGNNLLINEHYKAKQEFALKGFNAEIGVHPLAIRRNYDLYIAAGPYYFSGKNKDAWGGMARVKATGWKYFAVEIGDSYDHLFHNRFHVEATVSYPLGRRKQRSMKKASSNCFANNIMFYRAAQPADRQEIIVVDKRTKKYTIDPIAIDPTTGQPFYFVFVNNTANDATADGTFENPFRNLSTLDGAKNAQDASSAGNVIYVFSGDGLTTHMSNGVTLKDYQRFLGSGVSHQFVTTKGTVTVPAQTANLPSITGTVAPAVVVCGVYSNEVSGFNISTASAIGCIIANSVPSGGFRGNVSITRNFLNIPSGNAINADLSDVPGFPTTVLIDHNQMVGGRVGAGIMGVNPSTALIVTNNTNYNSLTGLVFAQTAGGAVGSALVSGNEAHGMPVDPNEVVIGFNAQPGSSFTVKVLNNYIHNNMGAFGISLQKDPLPTGSFQAEIAGNTLLTNTAGVRIRNATAPSSICARLVNNVAINNGGNDYVITNAAGCTLKLEPPDNNVGVIIPTGTITYVPACSCNVCP